MIFAKIDVVVPYANVGAYLPTCSFRFPRGETAEKLTINTKDADAAIQVREDDGAFPLEVETTEQDVPRGFSSFVYVTPVTGVRIRCREVGKTTRVSITAYG